jgi:hypothetical protein
MLPARGERIEREALPKVHDSHDRTTIGFQYVAAHTENLPADQAGGSDERDPSDYEI